MHYRVAITFQGWAVVTHHRWTLSTSSIIKWCNVTRCMVMHFFINDTVCFFVWVWHTGSVRDFRRLWPFLIAANGKKVCGCQLFWKRPTLSLSCHESIISFFILIQNKTYQWILMNKISFRNFIWKKDQESQISFMVILIILHFKRDWGEP